MAALSTNVPLTDQQLGNVASQATTQPAANAALSPSAVQTSSTLDPGRSALAGAAAATPQTAEEFLTQFRSQQPAAKPEVQNVANLQKRYMELSLAKDPGAAAAKAAYNAAYLALPSQEDKLALLKLTQAPSSANKLAGVRSIGAIGAKSGNSTLSDEQLARLAVGQQASAAQPQNDAEARALNTFLLQQGALQSQQTQQFVQDSTANLNPQLAAARIEQQAATQAATDAEINRRIAENVPGTNIGGGQFIGGTPGTPVLGNQPAAPPAPPAPVLAPNPALQQGLDVDQRIMADLSNISQRRAATAQPVGTVARDALDRARTTAAAQAIRAAAPPPSANKLAGVRNSTVIENRASTPERDAGIIAFAASMKLPNEPAPRTLEEARVILARNGI